MSAKKKILFIVNPISGVGRKNLIPGLVSKHFSSQKFETEIAFTEYRQHGGIISSAASNAFDAVIAVGGDGSVNEIGGALTGSGTALGIVPTGSGNGLARHLGIPMRIEAAMKRIANFQPSQMDTGTVNGLTFLGNCGFGFEAHIARKFDEYHHRGFSAYSKLVLREFGKYILPAFEISVDEIKLQGEFLMCGVANSRQFGNGFIISPKSNVSDGVMEIFILEKIRLHHFPMVIPRFFNGSIQKSKKFHSIPFTESARITVKSERPVDYQLDGEIMLGGPIFDIHLNRKHLWIL